MREYAHVRLPEMSPDERRDFTDTVYWHPALVLADGTVDVHFQLGDAVTRYQVLVLGHAADGRLGTLTTEIEARLPFTLEAKLPVEVTAGDRIDIPVAVANNTAEAKTVQLQVSAANLRVPQTKSQAQLELGPDGRGRAIFSLTPSVVEGAAEVTLEGVAGAFRDRVVRSLPIVPQGFPVEESHSDFLAGVAKQNLVLPDGWVPGTLQCKVQAYPSTLAALQKGLEGLLREPNGCFEQTSTSNYPNLLVLDYLRETDHALPAVEKRARELLAQGYAKLTSFECYESGPANRKGYEWFEARRRRYEALTAYGLMQFRDMARVYDVDASMVELRAVTSWRARTAKAASSGIRARSTSSAAPPSRSPMPISSGRSRKAARTTMSIRNSAAWLTRPGPRRIPISRRWWP